MFGRATTLRAVMVALATLVAAPLITPDAALATSVSEAERRLKAVVDELERLGERADQLAEDYAEAVDRRNGLDAEIAVAEVEAGKMAEQLALLRSELTDVAVRSFTSAGNDVLGPLFSSASVYNDVLQRNQYSRVALDLGSVTADDYAALLADYEAKEGWLTRNRAQVDALSTEIAQALKRAEEQSAEYERRRQEAERELGAAVAAEEQRRAEESYRRMLAQRPATPSGGGSGGGTGGGSGGGSSGGSGGGSGGVSAPVAPAPAVYPQPSSLAQVAVNAAMSQRGVPYRYASSIPGVAFDCSGLTHYAWGQAGVYLPRNSRAQFGATPRVPISAAQPGDLVYFYNPISHVGLYIGGGQMVHAPRTGDVVHVRSVNWDRVVGVTRPG